jgi:hypothetical protein
MLAKTLVPPRTVESHYSIESIESIVNDQVESIVSELERIRKLESQLLAREE